MNRLDAEKLDTQKEFEDLVQYKMPSYILDILHTYDESQYDLDSLEKELDQIQTIAIKAMKSTNIQEERLKISEYLRDFKNQFYIHFVSMLAYKVDKYQNEEDLKRMDLESKSMLLDYYAFMHQYIK